MADEKLLKLLLDDRFFDMNNIIDTQSGKADFSDANLRARDLRGCKFKKVNLKNAYLRLADLRGLDLREADLEGASLRDAKISGTYFPSNLDPQEIALSVEHGTRLRVKP